MPFLLHPVKVIQELSVLEKQADELPGEYSSRPKAN
jgi:hypothetical protein